MISFDTFFKLQNTWNIIDWSTLFGAIISLATLVYAGFINRKIKKLKLNHAFWNIGPDTLKDLDNSTIALNDYISDEEFPYEFSIDLLYNTVDKIFGNRRFERVLDKILNK